MALVLADRVLETSTSEGLGTFALAGAQTGYQTFSNGIGNGNTCYYTINGQTTEQWEVGIGTVGAGTLARTTLISSNTGSFINFVAGVKNVFVTQPASKSIYKDASGNAIPLGSASATQLDITAQGNLRLQDTTGGEYVALQAPATLAASYTLTMPTDDGTSGQALVTDGSGVLSWSTAASGDVYGPASATDNAVARFDLTTGKLIQNSVVTIDDTGNMAGVGTLSSGAITSSGQLTLTNASAYNLYANGAGANFMQGKLGIGALPAASTITLLGSNLVTGAATVNNIIVNGSIQSDVTSLYSSYVSNPGTAATAFTLATIRHFSATQQTFGVGSTVTTQHGFIANSTLTGATNNYGFYGNIASGTGRYNFYAAGTADNFMSGNLGVTGTPDVNLHVANGNAKLRLGSTALNAYLDISRDSVTGFTIYNAAQTTYSSHIFQIAGTEYARIGTTGTISLGAAPGSESLRVTPVASAVNYLQATGAVTTGAPVLSVAGTDTNIDLALTPKGTGVLSFGTYTAGVVVQAGYISIKDAAGTTRRLLVG